MSLQNYLICLSTEQLIELHSDLSSAGISFFKSQKKDKATKNSWRKIFEQRRLESSGKRKKIYAALYKAEFNEINNLLNVMVALYPGLKH